MAAYVVIPTPAEWEVLNRIFGARDEGGIIITPEAFEKLKGKGFGNEQINGLHFLEGYDYGGEGDYWIDVARPGNYAYTELKKVLSGKDDDDDDAAGDDARADDRAVLQK